MIIMGLVYISFPLYVMFTKPFSGFLQAEKQRCRFAVRGCGALSVVVVVVVVVVVFFLGGPGGGSKMGTFFLLCFFFLEGMK